MLMRHYHGLKTFKAHILTDNFTYHIVYYNSQLFMFSYLYIKYLFLYHRFINHIYNIFVTRLTLYYLYFACIVVTSLIYNLCLDIFQKLILANIKIYIVN